MKCNIMRCVILFLFVEWAWESNAILVFKALDALFRHSWKIDVFTFSYSFMTMLFPLPKKDAYRIDPHAMKRKCSLYTRHWLTHHLGVSRYSHYSSYLNGEWHFDIELLESYDSPSTYCIHLNINMDINVARNLHRLIQGLSDSHRQRTFLILLNFHIGISERIQRWRQSRQ